MKFADYFSKNKDGNLFLALIGSMQAMKSVESKSSFLPGLYFIFLTYP